METCVKYCRSNDKVDQVLKRIGETYDRKNHDYASEESPYSNFEFVAKFADVPVEKVFLVMEGIKIARLIELKKSGKVPNNESIEDTLYDFATYAVIHASYFKGEKG